MVSSFKKVEQLEKQLLAAEGLRWAIPEQPGCCKLSML